MKKIHTVFLIPVAMGCLAGTRAYADARADLESSSQAVRDKAARVLRATFKPSPKSKWLAVAAQLKKGDSHGKVLKTLRPFNAVEHAYGGGRRDMGMVFGQYQLDDSWALEFTYSGKGKEHATPDRLLSADVVWFVREVEVDEPEGFTGVWTTYYANGERYKVIRVRNKNGTVTEEVRIYQSNGKSM